MEQVDAFLLMSFGGPEGMEDVMPFLDNVLRGKNVPEERKLEVAHHYETFGGMSPINGQNRRLIEALKKEFAEHGIDLPIYWGNRNWDPYIADTLQQMKADGVTRVVSFFTSMYSCYSGCRQYREDISGAREKVEGAPEVLKLRMGFNHPGFLQANEEHIRAAYEDLDAGVRADAPLLFTAHSIPMGMADKSAYEKQLKETCGLLAERLGRENWQLVFQSRSGPPQMPWLEPDVCEVLETLDAQAVVISPVGFISDHLEVLYDLDTEAQETCDARGIQMARAATAGTHPAFIAMIRELVQERISGAEKRACGSLGAWHDVCPADCCPSGRPARR